MSRHKRNQDCHHRKQSLPVTVGKFNGVNAYHFLS